MMEELELTQEKKEQLLRRVTELLDEGILKMPDWMAIYDILLEACERDKINTMEQYLMECLKDG